MEVTRKKQCDKMMACHLEMDRVVYAVEKIQILGVVRAEGAGAPHKTLDAQGITGEFFFSLFALFLSAGYTSCVHFFLCLYILLRLSHGNNYIVVDSAKTTHLVS
jgi:hypothetical protein